ncbi:TPA: hypothetical protein RVR74_000546 [Aeromonas salmonicida]|nr:hypothetical protein [Aeromonas salmonicida]
MPIFLFLLIVVEIIAFIGLIFGGNLSDDTLMICYAAIAVLTMPVWTGFLAMGVVGIADWFEKRHRTKRIARAKAAKLVSSG